MQQLQITPLSIQSSIDMVKLYSLRSFTYDEFPPTYITVVDTEQEPGNGI